MRKPGDAHGLSGTPTYRSWNAMMQRCGNPKTRGYSEYGGRGIKVCDAWRDVRVFVRQMGERPSMRHSLDRIDCDGDYTPENCRWATPREQSANLRTNINIEHEGRTQNMSEWARELGVYHSVLFARYQKGQRGAELLRRKTPYVKLCIDGVCRWRWEWAKMSGLNLSTIYNRERRGWPPHICVASNKDVLAWKKTLTKGSQHEH